MTNNNWLKTINGNRKETIFYLVMTLAVLLKTVHIEDVQKSVSKRKNNFNFDT